jgi:hypothetical protein
MVSVNGTKMELVMDYSAYASEGDRISRVNAPRSSIFHGIPIQFRDSFPAYARSIGLKGYRILYRGPRNKRHNGQSICPRSMATSFAVYSPEQNKSRYSLRADGKGTDIFTQRLRFDRGQNQLVFSEQYLYTSPEKYNSAGRSMR